MYLILNTHNEYNNNGEALCKAPKIQQCWYGAKVGGLHFLRSAWKGLSRGGGSRASDRISGWPPLLY